MKGKKYAFGHIVSTCQLQVPTNYQDVTQWRHCNVCNAGAIRISFQIQVLAIKLEIASHCHVLFPIPLKQMRYWFTADSFSKCGLWQWSWKQVCEASSPIPALKCSSRLKTVGWRKRGCWAVNGTGMEKLHIVMNTAKVCDLAYCMWCWLYQSLKQMWGKIELHFLPAIPGPLWLSGGLWCFRKIPYIPVRL